MARPAAGRRRPGRVRPELSTASLATDPGAEFAYCNAGYEVLGHVVATVTGRTFEAAMTELVLDPAGMVHSTFLRADVPSELASSPHVGAPLVVPPGAEAGPAEAGVIPGG